MAAGEGGGGKTPILKINVETEAYDKFIDSFMHYQSLLEKQSDAWAGTNKGIKQTKSAFDEVEHALSDLVEKATSSKFSGPTSGVFVRVGKESRETAKAWATISKEVEKVSRGLTGIARNGGAGVFGLFGTAGALAGGLYGATAGAANSVAGDYKSSRELGLEIGKEKEFGIVGKPFGLGRDQLDEAANAKADPTKQLPFLNAGVSAQDLAKLDAAELAWKKAEGEAKLYSQWEKTSPQFAVAQAGAFFPGENPDQLRLLADAYDKGGLGRAHDLYEKNWPKVGYDQQQGEAATQFKQDQAQKWAEVETAWNRDILFLAPVLDRWSTAATNLTTNFLDASAHAIKDLTDAGDHPYPPGTEPPPVKGDTWGERAGSYVANREVALGQWLQRHGLPNPFNDAGNAATGGQKGFTSDPDKAAHMAALEKMYGMPKGSLQAQENIESSGGRNLANPNNPNHVGAFQFDEATAKKFSVDRHDEYSSTVGAARYLADLKKRYGSWDKAYAAFDGFGGLDKDIAKYGDKWKDHIGEFQKSGETEQYLRKLTWQGVDLDSSQPATAFDDPKNIKTAKAADKLNDPQIVPFTDADQRAKDADSTSNQPLMNESLTDRLMRGLGIAGTAMRDGGGSQFRTPDAQRKTANATAQQFNIQMQVTAPAGTDVQVTGAQLAQ
jgi:hypothetical protein